MRVATVSCRENEFAITRNNLLNCNDIAGSWCFGSRIHIPLKESTRALKDYDVVWFTMSKQIRKYEGYWMDLMCTFKGRWPNKKVILHQEAEAEFYLTRDNSSGGWKLQRGWIEALADKVDLLLAHNARDAGLYRFFAGGKVETWRTVQDVDRMHEYRIGPADKKKVIGISSYDGRANGVVGAAVASQFTEDIVQITRGPYPERGSFVNERFGINPKVEPMCGWFQWLKNMSNLYLYLHPMPAASAGRDTIACAALGIPVIGNKYLDAQNALFPDLAVDVYDTRRMEQLVTELLYDGSFYGRVREKAMKGVEFYNIDHGVDRATKIMQGLGWK